MNSNAKNLIRGLVRKNESAEKNETVTLSGEEFFRLMNEAAELGAKQAREEFMKPFIDRIEEAGRQQTELVNKAGQEALDSVEQAGKELEETGSRTLNDIKELSDAAEQLMDGAAGSPSPGNGIHVEI